MGRELEAVTMDMDQMQQEHYQRGLEIARLKDERDNLLALLEQEKLATGEAIMQLQERELALEAALYEMSDLALDAAATPNHAHMVGRTKGRADSIIQRAGACAHRLKAKVLRAERTRLACYAGGPEGHIPQSQRYLLNLMDQEADRLENSHD